MEQEPYPEIKQQRAGEGAQCVVIDRRRDVQVLRRQRGAGKRGKAKKRLVWRDLFERLPVQPQGKAAHNDVHPAQNVSSP